MVKVHAGKTLKQIKKKKDNFYYELLYDMKDPAIPHVICRGKGKHVWGILESDKDVLPDDKIIKRLAARDIDAIVNFGIKKRKKFFTASELLS